MLYGGGARLMSDGRDFLGRSRFAFFAALSCGRDTDTTVSPRVDVWGAMKAEAEATRPRRRSFAMG